METKISVEEFMRLQSTEKYTLHNKIESQGICERCYIMCRENPCVCEGLFNENQLIALRTANYALEEQNAAHTVKNKEMSLRLETLEKECNKLNSSLSISRRMKNVDLFNRNETLQQKLQTQEDDFRLQNETLMKELALLDAENKKLQSKVSANEVEAEESLEVKKLKEEASALQRVLSEERLRSANEICKLRTALNLFVEGVDDEIKNNFFTDLESGISLNMGNVKIGRVSSSPIEYMTRREDTTNSGDESTELITDAEDSSECNDSRCELIKTKEELELLKSKWGVEIETLADLINNRKDKYESLKTALAALEGRFVKCRSVADQMIHELEAQLADAVEEGNTIKQEKKDLEGQLLELKNELSEKSMESEIVHSQFLASVKELENMKYCVETLKTSNASLAESAEKLKKELIRKDEMIEDLTSKQKQLVAEYDDMISQIVEKDKAYEHKLKEVSDKLQELQEKYDNLEKSSIVKDKDLKELEQQVSDINTERALSEKKGSVICRDLKRQLALERRRAEKLQEKLRDLDSSNIKQDSSKSGDAEVTSVSSWSLMSGNMEPQELSTQESQITGSPVNINGNVFPQAEEMDLEQENKNLLERLTALQEEKWLLEEQINHLEQGSAAMADDLMKKADLIKFYCMDSRQGDPQPTSSGRKGVRKLSEFLKGSEGESMQESHARMQRMLEETLTKNMYLQRDIEHLSQELETIRLSSKMP